MISKYNYFLFIALLATCHYYSFGMFKIKEVPETFYKHDKNGMPFLDANGKQIPLDKATDKTESFNKFFQYNITNITCENFQKLEELEKTYVKELLTNNKGKGTLRPTEELRGTEQGTFFTKKPVVKTQKISFLGKLANYVSSFIWTKPVLYTQANYNLYKDHNKLNYGAQDPNYDSSTAFHGQNWPEDIKCAQTAGTFDIWNPFRKWQYSNTVKNRSGTFETWKGYADSKPYTYSLKMREEEQ